MAKKFQPLPTDSEKLREMVDKLKDKEARLEADLAIKDCPVLEDGILTIMLAMGDVKKLDTQLRITSRPEIDNTAEALRLQNLIKFYESKIKTCKVQMAELSEGDDGKFVRMRLDRTKALERLHEYVEEWEDAFSDAGVVLVELIPSLDHVLSITM